MVQGRSPALLRQLPLPPALPGQLTVTIKEAEASTTTLTAWKQPRFVRVLVAGKDATPAAQVAERGRVILESGLVIVAAPSLEGTPPELANDPPRLQSPCLQKTC